MFTGILASPFLAYFLAHSLIPPESSRITYSLPNQMRERTTNLQKAVDLGITLFPKPEDTENKLNEYKKNIIKQ